MSDESEDTKVVDMITKLPYSPTAPTAEEVLHRAEDDLLWCSACEMSDMKIIGPSIYCSTCLHKIRGFLVLNPDDLGLAPPEDGVHEDD